MSRFLKWVTAAFAVVSIASSWSLAQEVTITIQGNPKPQAAQKAPFDGSRPAVDVAILLDTSNSMDGLINQAKGQLWKIVQEFASAKKSGKTPSLRVAVFEYGNTNLPASEGYIRQVVPLTDNLDVVSEGLVRLVNQWRRRVLRASHWRSHQTARLVLRIQCLQDHFYRRE